MSFSFAKLKSLIPGIQNSSNTEGTSGKRHSLSLEPEIGFQLALEPGAINTITTTNQTCTTSSNNKNENIGPSLNVHLISARHLPSIFGFKTVQGYQIKVKLFPGSKRYESSIQTCSWPKFDETYKFPLEPDIKPSIKNYVKEKNTDNLPEKLCSGNFVVFTVYALLELPPGTFNRFKGTYRSLREKSNNLLKGGKSTEANQNDKSKETKDNSTPQQLTQSESRRNIGSVTCFLDSKLFKENRKSGRYITDEMWLPIKDITVTPSKSSSTASSAKGQIELILELCDAIKDEISANEIDTATTTISSSSATSGRNDIKQKEKFQQPVLKKQWSLNEVKKKIKSGKSSKDQKQLFLKVTTSKMRCSIKVKDEFENSAGQIYVKTTIFEHQILSNSWKCDNFLPSLSTRWDPEQSTIIVPIGNEENLKNISIRATVATKTKVGKKIVLGTILIGPQTSGSGLEHWHSVLSSKNEPVAKWHNFQ